MLLAFWTTQVWFIVFLTTVHVFIVLDVLVLTVVAFYSQQQKDDRKLLKRWQWSCVLMDEAHALKDKNSYRWKNLMSVARNANQRLMLTGTPLQNDLHVYLLIAFLSINGMLVIATSVWWNNDCFADPLYWAPPSSLWKYFVIKKSYSE